MRRIYYILIIILIGFKSCLSLPPPKNYFYRTLDIQQRPYLDSKDGGKVFFKVFESDTLEIHSMLKIRDLNRDLAYELDLKLLSNLENISFELCDDVKFREKKLLSIKICSNAKTSIENKSKSDSLYFFWRKRFEEIEMSGNKSKVDTIYLDFEINESSYRFPLLLDINKKYYTHSLLEF